MRIMRKRSSDRRTAEAVHGTAVPGLSSEAARKTHSPDERIDRTDSIMTMTDIFEKNKENFIRQTETAATPDQAKAVIETTLDRTLYEYNENCGNDRVREAASGFIRAARTEAPLVNSVGDVKIWDRYVGEGGQEQISWRFLAPVVIGLVLTAAVLMTQTTNLLRLPIAIVMIAAAMFCFFLAGRFAAKKNVQGRLERKYECLVDADMIYRTLHSVMMVIDQNIDQILLAEKWESMNRSESAAGAPDETEMALFSGLLEAEYSGDSEYAFEKLSELRYYLHTRNINIVNFSEEHAEWFDRLPSETKGTLRPALVSDGKLLKKGLVGA